MKPSEILAAYGETIAVASNDYLFVTDHALTETTMAAAETVLEGVQESKRVYYTKGDIAAAITAIGTTQCDLIVDASEILGADVTIPSTITLRASRGAIITVPNGITLTINGPFEVDRQQVFSCTGTGAVSGLTLLRPEWFGALANGSTDDSGAIADATAALAAYGVLKLQPTKTYSIEAAISLPTNCILDMQGATIKSHYAGSAIKFGTAGTLIGNGARIYNDVDYGGGLISTTVKNDEAEIKILGWPYIYNGATARYAGSIGIDGETFYKSVIEVRLANFETGILIGNGTESNYYNRIHDPFIVGCTYGIKGMKSTLELLTLDVAPGTDWAAGDTITGASSSVTAKIHSKYGSSGLIWRIYDRSGTFTDGEILSNGTYSADQGVGYPYTTALNTNDLRITNPQINGSSAATRALYFDGVGSLSIIGGYIEGMLVSNCRGLYMDDCNGVVVEGITFDSTAGASQYAIEAIGSTQNVTLNGNRFGGSWANTDRWLSWTATGTYNYKGQEAGFGKRRSQVGNFKVSTIDISKDIEGDASTTITLSIPSGAKILGAHLQVTSALAAGELWDAAYSGGSTTAIAAAQAVAVNTKVTAMYDENAATAITTNTTNIAITKNGGGSFTAQGTIRAIVAYEYFEPLADL